MLFCVWQMDATIALSLQQEENLQRAASFLRQGQPHPVSSFVIFAMLMSIHFLFY